MKGRRARSAPSQIQQEGISDLGNTLRGPKRANSMTFPLHLVTAIADLGPGKADGDNRSRSQSPHRANQSSLQQLRRRPLAGHDHPLVRIGWLEILGLRVLKDHRKNGGRVSC